MTRRDWLAAEPFTLALGAGFFGFFAHTGVLSALESVGLRPRRVVGVSAGALAGGLWAAGLDSPQLEAELVGLRRGDFWDPGLPLGGLLRGRKFTAKLQEVTATTGIETIEQCRVPFTAVAHDVLRRVTLPLDRGPLVAAIQASCTVPLMFRPRWDRGRLLVDGGVSDRDGTSGIEPGERVLMHHLVSRRRWRRPTAAPREVTGETMVLVTPGLPRVTPFRLQQGPKALAHARAHALEWLLRPPGGPDAL